MSNKDNDKVSVGVVEQISIDESHIDTTPDLDSLAILPTLNLVLLPKVTISISLRRELSEKVARRAYERCQPVGIVCQRDPDDEKPTLRRGLYQYGVLADILKVIELPNGDKTVLVRGREPFKITAAGLKTGHVTGALVAKAEILPQYFPEADDPRLRSMLDTLREKIGKMGQNMPDGLGQLLTSISNCDDPELMVNLIITNFPAESFEKMLLLAETNFMNRVSQLLDLVMRKEEEMEISMEIMRRVHNDMDDEQKRAFLQHQIQAIQEQLYGDSSNEISELEARRDKAKLPKQALEAFNKELTKLRRLNPQSPDYSVMYTYLDTVLDLPWNERTDTHTDLEGAARILDADHYGLEKVKERILEQLAVIMHRPDGKAPIICLVGAPGVGKTSLGQSVAKALGRNYARVSLGGLHDEAEIRGHRRTYIGAMPGRIIEALRRAKSSNALLVLDEIDKIGADYKGDPSAALLEVLDPEQNNKFHDNYIDIDFDLSHVFFIATANTLSTVPQPLIDRMEIIDLSGYLPEEKREIARRHLLPRIFTQLEIPSDSYTITDDALNDIIDRYTNESGVRQLDKRLATIARKYLMALMQGKKADFPSEVRPEHLKGLLGLAPYNKDRCEDNEFAGVVTGLAWTQTGGEILLVESSLSAGKGKLTLTGNLGDVMKESASIALQWVKAHAGDLGIDPETFDKHDIHLHFPEGAIPKDGPSAGITIATSLVSLLLRRRVRARLAMTGEITLRGKVLPVGGIKEKILAAKRAGITDIVLSKDNRRDIDDIAPVYVEGLNFHYVDKVAEVIALAVTDDEAIL